MIIFGKGKSALRTIPAIVLGIGIWAAMSPSGASASTLSCQGDIDAVPDQVQSYEYKISCRAPFTSPSFPGPRMDGFSVISTQLLDHFSPELTILTPAGEPATGEFYSCEGAIPDYGFGCIGAAGAAMGNAVIGEFSLLNDPCSEKARRKGRWKAWMTVAYGDVDPRDGKSKPASSEPFQLRTPKCQPIESKNGAGK